MDDSHMPASREAFRQMIEDGADPVKIARATVSAFSAALEDFMQAVPKSRLDTDVQWQLIHLSVAVENVLARLDASVPPDGVIAVTGEDADELLAALMDVLGPLAAADAEARQRPPEGGGEGNGHGSPA